jgi:hypothetical protein
LSTIEFQPVFSSFSMSKIFLCLLHIPGTRVLGSATEAKATNYYHVWERQENRIAPVTEEGMEEGA